MWRATPDRAELLDAGEAVPARMKLEATREALMPNRNRLLDQPPHSLSHRLPKALNAARSGMGYGQLCSRATLVGRWVFKTASPTNASAASEETALSVPPSVEIPGKDLAICTASTKGLPKVGGLKPAS